MLKIQLGLIGLIQQVAEIYYSHDSLKNVTTLPKDLFSTQMAQCTVAKLGALPY